ncbi:class I SAM-dependent methyltransferase [PVC group bacterium]|nr:class I SAM-dependent methyltransferase [PVC group bacterium]
MKNFQSLYHGNELGERINVQEKYSSLDLKEWLKSLYEFRKDDTVLDLGCGNGKELVYFSPYFSKGVGVDNSEKLIKNAQEKKDAKGFKNISFIYADCNEFISKDIKFNVIYSNFSFYYFDEKEVFKNICEMLSSDGTVFIGGSPDDNAPEVSCLISRLLNKEEVPLTYRSGFSDIKKYRNIFKDHFRSVQYYRFDNEIRFPDVSVFLVYLKNTTLCQSLRQDRREYFLEEARKILEKKENTHLTKVVDVLKASHIK